MIPVLDQAYPDSIGIANKKTVTLDTYKKSIIIILGSEVFTLKEIKYLSDTLEYNDLIKIIIFNSSVKEHISDNVIYIDSNFSAQDIIAVSDVICTIASTQA